MKNLYFHQKNADDSAKFLFKEQAPAHTESKGKDIHGKVANVLTLPVDGVQKVVNFPLNTLEAGFDHIPYVGVVPARVLELTEDVIDTGLGVVKGAVTLVSNLVTKTIAGVGNGLKNGLTSGKKEIEKNINHNRNVAKKRKETIKLNRNAKNAKAKQVEHKAA